MEKIVTRFLVLVLTLLVTSQARPESPPIETHLFFSESGWNRSGKGLLFNLFRMNGTSAVELGQEWTPFGDAHQLGYTIPMFADGMTRGLGDGRLNYRYQLVGGSDSRGALAARVSLILPTRASDFGERSSGVEIAMPFSVALSSSLTTHASASVSWFRERGEREWKLGNGISWTAGQRLLLSAEAEYVRSGGEATLVVRPSIQLTIDGPGRITIAPGVGAPLGGDGKGLLLFLAVDHPLH